MDSTLFSPATPLYLILLALVGWMIKTWPVWKGKVNEARKIELDGAASLRGDLLVRIADLERARVDDRTYFDNLMATERLRCDKELEKMRLENRGLVDLIRQHSQSSAVLIGDPGGTAITQAARKRRGDQE